MCTQTASVPSETAISIETVDRLEFDAVYEAQFDYTYRVVVRLAGIEHAEDLTQEVFAVVHRRLQEFEGRAKLTTWLFQIAYRVVGAHLRRERLRRLCFGPTRDADDHDAATSATALRGLVQAEDSAALARALAKLPWKKRAVLVLHEVEEWSGELIAERLGIPVATVWTRLHHARK
ncbi:MAG: RNA polymerase sigma factor, partial [Deltaproteobacteria bacterium]|nr:RNA polymerase sigma factor [Deltaproteobacteria bacterium]